ncbi:MAG: hypothetical protein ACK43M_22370 [Allorhizobium sp.]
MTAPSTRTQLSIRLTPANRKRLTRLKVMMDAETLDGAIMAALVHGIDRLMLDLPLRGPGNAKVHHRIPADLWATLRDMARANARSTNDEVIAALAHWVKVAQTKKGRAPA